jgi:sugar lactone lactonase YvrE
MNRRVILIAACLTAFGCTLKPPTATKPGAVAEGVVRNGLKPTIVKRPSPVPDTFFGQGGGLVSNSGSTVVSNNGSSLVGVVRAPSTLISNNGGSIISDNGLGYRVLATSEVPVSGLDVILVTADGTPVTDAKGVVITTKTDAQGKYKLPFSGSTANLVVRVALPNQKGSLLAFVSKRSATGDRTVDIDFKSTLVMGYILGQYVKGDQQILEKLPEDVETETRAKMAAAIEKSTEAPPTALTSAQIGLAVDALRAQDPGIDAQMEKVKRILLVGLSDQGAGLPATSVETDAVPLAISPAGEVFYGGSNTRRVWRKDAQGLLRPYAGNGSGPTPADVSGLGATQSAPGDGGAATNAPLYPGALAFDKDGNLYIGDMMLKRVRKVDPAGIITTAAAHADWVALRGLAIAQDGGLLVATSYGIDHVAADKTITRLAGGTRGVPAAGATSALRFRGIHDIAVDPANGDVLVLDESGVLVRIAGATATIEAGKGTPGFSGDGGPATQGAFSGTGGIAFTPDGAILMADLGNRRIRRIQGGTLSTVAGSGAFGFGGDGGTAMQAGMVNPRSVRVAPNGDAYTADIGFVRRLANGTLSTVIGQIREAGAQPLDKVQLRNPKGLWYDAQAHAILVAELWRVRKWNLATDMVETVTSAGLSGAAFQEGGAPTASTLFNFYGLTMGSDGALTMLADDVTFKRRLLRQQGGTLVTLAGNGTDKSLAGVLLQLDAPAADAAVQGESWPVAVKGEQAFYSIFLGASQGKAIIAAVTPGGNLTELTRVASATQLGGLAVSPDGESLFIGALGLLYRYDFATKQVTEVARDGGSNTPEAMGLPSGFAWDAAGNMYFADFATSRVRRLDKATGTIRLIAGAGAPLLGGTGVDDSLVSPWGVALDKDGHLYVSDMGANQIKKIPASKLP